MKNYLFIRFLIFFSCVSTISLKAQTVSGLISDSSGPLPGANVFIKNTNNGTITNFDGIYIINGVNDGAILVVEFLGYASQEILISNKNEIDVVLVEDTSQLDEVVVVVYGTKKKSLVTGAISSVSSDQFETASNQRVEQVLQGRTAGVTVTSSSGSPGSGSKIRIRGTGSNGDTSPLYIVDGIKISNIDNLVPSDIANIEVLKDAASTAIYGSEGANGVIIISTKQGKVGKSVFSVNSQIGFESIRTDMELMNAAQFVEYMNEAGQLNVQLNGVDTDWIEETFQDALVQRHDVSFSGASEKTSYYLSGSMLDQEGVISGGSSGYNRYSFRANVKSDVKDWLEVGANLTYSKSENSSVSENNDTRGVIQNLIILDPLTPVFYPEGEVPQSVVDASFTNGNVPLLADDKGNVYGYPTYSTGEVLNPVAYANELSDSSEDTDYFMGAFYGKFKITEGLTFTSRIGVERRNAWKKTINIPYYVSAEVLNGSYGVSEEFQRTSKWLWENFATYQRSLGDHNFTLLAGYTAEKYEKPSFSASGTTAPGDFTDPYLNYVDSVGNIGGDYETNNLVGIIGRLSYDFKEKYLIEASIRHDTSSLPSKEYKSDYFPSISSGWVISKEDFWNTDISLNFLKLRASWGQNGSVRNLRGNADFIYYQNQLDSGLINYEDFIGTEVAFLANNELKWETSEQLDLGVDLKAFDRKLNFTFDYYKKTTKDLILTAGELITPPSVGNIPKEFNGGTIVNKGLEFELGWQDDIGVDFTYGVNLNLSTLDNEVTEILFVPDGSSIDGSSSQGSGETITRFQEGFPVWYFYGYKTEGIDSTTGQIIITDTDGVEGITDADKTQIGSPHPELLYGANFNLGYKGIDFNLQLQGSYGNDIMTSYHNASRPITNRPVHWFTDRWTEVGDVASLPSAEFAGTAYETDLVIEDGSYMRIKQIQLGYTLPRQAIEGVGLSNLRLYVSLDDYFTFTKYSGLDPEVGGGDDNAIGVDKGFYPVAAKTIFGASLEF